MARKISLTVRGVEIPPDTRTVGPLLNDGAPYREDSQTGGVLFCSGVSGKGEKEPPRIRTVSAVGLKYDDPMRRKDDDED